MGDIANYVMDKDSWLDLNSFIIPFELQDVSRQELQSKSPKQLSYTHHDETGYRRLSLSLIDFIADFMGVDPTETKLDLDEHVALNELDRVFENMDERTGHLVRFPYEGYCVEVALTGEMIIFDSFYCMGDGVIDLSDSKD